MRLVKGELKRKEKYDSLRINKPDYLEKLNDKMIIFCKLSLFRSQMQTKLYVGKIQKK